MVTAVEPERFGVRVIEPLSDRRDGLPMIDEKLLQGSLSAVNNALHVDGLLARLVAWQAEWRTTGGRLRVRDELRRRRGGEPLAHLRRLTSSLVCDVGAMEWNMEGAHL